MDPLEFLAWVGRHGSPVFAIAVGIAVVYLACDLAMSVARLLTHKGPIGYEHRRSARLRRNDAATAAALATWRRRRRS